MPRHKYSTAIEILSFILRSGGDFRFSDYLRGLDSRSSKSRYLKIVSRLDRDGLIQKSGEKGKLLIKITNEGKELMKSFKKSSDYNIPSYKYSTDKSEGASVPIIVAFDVPEKYRYKRDWLRKALTSIGLKMAQRSLWIGKAKIPRQFLKDIKYLGLEDYVEIFAVSKSGSLQDLL